MASLPLIFISAVSRELRSGRQLAANTLTFLGYQPIWQDVFGTETGDLRGMLRQQIDQCKGVLQIVGNCYGAEPPQPDPEFGRVSYTQYEALYARKRGKKVWYLFIDETFPVDPCEAEPAELRALQAAYRQRLQSDAHLFHPLTSREGLEASVLKLRDDLVRLRRGVKRWAAGVAIMLALSVGLGVWLLYNQRESTKRIVEAQQAVVTMSQEMTKLREGILKYPRVEAEVRQSQTEENPAVVQQKVYDALSKEVGVDSKVLQQKLPDVAINLQRAPDATTYEKANAAYVANNFMEAERLALQAVEELQKNSSKPAEIVQAYQLAGFSAQKRIQFKTALDYFRSAEKLTDRQANAAQWADVQHAIGDLLMEQGSYREAEDVLRAAADAREKALGADNADTLRSRTRVAYAQYRQGKYNEAVEGFRGIVGLEERMFGPMHPDTLLARNGLAIALDNAGKPGEAEAEHRRILAIREKVLGPEHPDTLRTRNNIALTLDRQGKHAEAASEYQQVIDLENKVLGPEHPDTLKSRSSFAYALDHQGKYSEAELNLRDVIRLEERVLGPEHPDTLVSRLRLDKVLMSQGKFAEAETDYRALVTLEQKVLGPEHPDTLSARSGLANALQAQGKHSDAAAEYRAVIALEERVLGPQHPNTLLNRNNLANSLMATNAYVDSQNMFRELIDLETKALGPDDALTMRSHRGLANALFNQGNYSAAEPEYREVLRIAERLRGADHLETLDACYDLAGNLARERKLPEAKDLARRAAETARKRLSPNHPATQKYNALVTELETKNAL
ncbi:MAG TPA: tetratricopeptide repeat protein [Chthoniobacterales bacterium]|jgi:tetratricopeptide (TPR) repeat protein|nr:tetratricopeptide repeat protein [Chthoniobacterales bacterium]